jgi:MFS family permease
LINGLDSEREATSVRGASGYQRRWWALAVLCLSLVVLAMDNTILNVALPTLARDPGAIGSQLQWTVDAYLLLFAGLLLTMGAAGDRFTANWPSTPVCWCSRRPRPRRRLPAPRRS